MHQTPLLFLLLPSSSYYNGLPLTGTTKSRSRVTLAGSIIATIALFALIMVVSERKKESDTPLGVGWRRRELSALSAYGGEWGTGG